MSLRKKKPMRLHEPTLWRPPVVPKPEVTHAERPGTSRSYCGKWTRKQRTMVGEPTCAQCLRARRIAARKAMAPDGFDPGCVCPKCGVWRVVKAGRKPSPRAWPIGGVVSFTNPTHLRVVSVDAQNVVRFPVRVRPSNMDASSGRSSLGRGDSSSRPFLSSMVREHPGMSGAAA